MKKIVKDDILGLEEWKRARTVLLPVLIHEK